MSVQFGKWSFSGQPPDLAFLNSVEALIDRYGPYPTSRYHLPNLEILYRPFHTTKESRREMQPHFSPRTVIMWDGHLHNRSELVRVLKLSFDEPDVSIVAAAYDRWGTDSLAKLVGDWALSVWSAQDRTLLLAKDPVGTHSLFYSTRETDITWSSLLDALVVADATIDPEYIAGWLGSFPATHLTPYAGIHSVPPSCYALLKPGSCRVEKYWDFDPRKRIHYRSDAEYEEHFRVVFGHAVQHALRSDAPVLAELSGGMDSSSIVCMADTVIARGAAETPRLDTVSYYNDSEPNWNERPYFTRVEQLRGRPGCHIDLGSRTRERFAFPDDRIPATPSAPGCPSESSKKFAAYLTGNGNNVLLSGTGGDEIMGGLPTPIPELMDLLATAKIRQLATKLKLWALQQRKPWPHLLWASCAPFVLNPLAAVGRDGRFAPWIRPAFAKRFSAAIAGYPSRTGLFGPLPSFQVNLATLELLRRQLSCELLPCQPSYEKRYPFLDRDLLEFVYAIPREQLVRPTQRRSLLRRALRGIVPAEVFERRRKAYVTRAISETISAEHAQLLEHGNELVTESLGFVDAASFAKAFDNACHGEEVAVIPMLRTIGLEHWMRHMRGDGFWLSSNQREIRTELRSNRRELRERTVGSPASP